MSKPYRNFLGGRITPALILCLSLAVSVNAAGLSLEKTREFYVNTPDIRSVFPGVTGSWLSLGQGFVFAKGHDLCYYSQDMQLLRQVKISDSTPYGATHYAVIDDSILSLLDCSGYIEAFDCHGNKINRRFLPKDLDVNYISFQGSKIAFSGMKELRHDYKVPQLVIMDTLDPDQTVTVKNLYPDSILDRLNQENKGMFITLKSFSFKDGFLLTGSAGSEVFFISSEGVLEWEIKIAPQGYRHIVDAPVFERERSISDKVYFTEWQYSFDGTRQICTINDSFIVITRNGKVQDQSYFLDVYNVNNKCFVQRMELTERLMGASGSELFFLDSLANNIMKISAYRLEPGTLSGDSVEVPIVLTANEDCSNCGKPIKPYPFVESEESTQDSLYAGHGRYARVYDNSWFEPEKLTLLCTPGKNNMFIFYYPAEFRGDLLLDTTLSVLNGHDDWHTTIVLCYPKPDELKLYLSDLPGDRILINRNQAIPEKTLAFGDLPLPPMLVAFIEGNQDPIGYSLGPRYDKNKTNSGHGITFDEFLGQCGLLE